MNYEFFTVLLLCKKRNLQKLMKILYAFIAGLKLNRSDIRAEIIVRDVYGQYISMKTRATDKAIAWVKWNRYLRKPIHVTGIT